MSFFDDVPTPPPPPEPPAFEHKPWMGPPPGWAGGWVPWHVVLIHTSDIYATLSGLEAYPTGVTFGFTAHLRPVESEDGVVRIPMSRMMDVDPDGPRIGVGFSDGRKAVAGHFVRRNVEPIGPLLTFLGGGGGGTAWKTSLWLWPLPPPGPLQIVVSWKAEGVEERAFDFDASDLIEGAAKAPKLWDHDPALTRRRFVGRTGRRVSFLRDRNGETPTVETNEADDGSSEPAAE